MYVAQREAQATISPDRPHSDHLSLSPLSPGKLVFGRGWRACALPLRVPVEKSDQFRCRLGRTHAGGHDLPVLQSPAIQCPLVVQILPQGCANAGIGMAPPQPPRPRPNTVTWPLKVKLPGAVRDRTIPHRRQSAVFCLGVARLVRELHWQVLKGDQEMDLVNLAVVLIVVGVGLWLVNRLIPMAPSIRRF
jgi:hypothetical protein